MNYLWIVPGSPGLPAQTYVIPGHWVHRLTEDGKPIDYYQVQSPTFPDRPIIIPAAEMAPEVE